MEHEVDWAHWEALIRRNGIEIDRPKGSAHPRYDDWIYPLDYGFIPSTIGSDLHEIDVFRGTAAGSGLVGALIV